VIRDNQVIMCDICNTPKVFHATATVLGRYQVAYYRCSNCGYLSTETPYWLDEAYARPINISDTGLMARNILNVRMTSSIIKLCFNTDGKFVDYGGGHGIFVRMMRDQGFDFYRDDKYCANLFANGFDASDSGANSFELLTAFEVFEHFASPCDELCRLLQKSKTILFTTVILPDNPPQPSKWWYYGLDNGQHISFYTRKSLQYLANKYGLYYFYNGNIHLFTRVKPCAMSLKFQLATNPRISRLFEVISRKEPLTNSDYKKITGMDTSEHIEYDN